MEKHLIYSTLKSGIDERAGIDEKMLIDLGGLWTFIPE